MDQTQAAWVQAGASTVAVFIAIVALKIARDARNAEKDQAKASRDALALARRQVALSLVPHLSAAMPALTPGSASLSLAVRNGGPGVAYGVMATVRGSDVRAVDDALEHTRSASGRWAAFRVQEDPLSLRVPLARLSAPGNTFTHPWLVVSVEYYSPLGTVVRHDYIAGPYDEADRPLWRLHRITIDPRDGDDPIVSNFALGSDEAPKSASEIAQISP